MEPQEQESGRETPDRVAALLLSSFARDAAKTRRIHEHPRAGIRGHGAPPKCETEPRRGQHPVVPMPPEFVEELRAFRRRLGALAGFMFSAEQNATKPMDRHQFDKWLIRAERKAQLPKLRGGAWHPYRRKWATERKQAPITDVAAAGGWSDVHTLLDCYQQPTNDALLAVMSEERKLRDRAVVQRNGQRTGNAFCTLGVTRCKSIGTAGFEPATP